MTLQTVLGLLIACGLALLLIRRAVDRRARAAAEPQRLFENVAGLLENPRLDPTGTVGVHRLVGDWRGLPVQVQTVVDTLAVRKLPSLWLMVTIPDALPLSATFDLMMRPASATSFSNYDHLAHGVALPPGFPEHAGLRTDNPAGLLPASLITPHLDVFDNPRTKELLISPKGLRLVVQLAEADRARYGVFRQADFGTVTLEPEAVLDILHRLARIRQAILDGACKPA